VARRVELLNPWTANPDGGERSFWLSVPDFARHFNRLFVCHAPQDSHDVTQLTESWGPGRAGGCSDFATFRHNPQYRLRRLSSWAGALD
jgi:hypothetical protein